MIGNEKQKYCKNCARLCFDRFGAALCDRYIGAKIKLGNTACSDFEETSLHTDCVNFDGKKCRALSGREILCSTEACRFYKIKKGQA